MGCLKKIAQREGQQIDWREAQKLAQEGQSYYLSWRVPKEYQWLGERLDQLFREYHQEQKAKSMTSSNFADLSRVEFETRIANILKQHGFLDVRGTPSTEDQGGDLIAKMNDQTIVIQAKRYQGGVGNKAVQEVIGARHYYNANEAWVITNSTFSSSAKELAQKSQVSLIDGHTLLNIETFLDKWRAEHG